MTVAFALAVPPAPLQASEYVDTPAVAGVAVMLPEVAMLPLQEPPAVQVFAFVDDHDKLMV